MKRIATHILLLISFVLLSTKLLALGYKDSIGTAKPPKHYFSKTIYLDSYAPQKIKLDHVKPISQMLETYQLRQFSFGCNLPVFTKDFYSADGTRISNFHLLLNASVVNLKVSFDGISTHTLSNTSIGMRALYNDGKKGIFYVEMAPFLSQDRGYTYTKTLRMASTVLYNYSVNDRFAFRVGYTRTFLWGNRYHLPFIGFRVGRIDKVNLSVQFPRNITFSMPVSNTFRLSLYTKPVGGLYTFANVDSIPLGGVVSDNKNIYFGRYEFLSGVRMDVQPSKHISFYFGSGLTTKNKMLFYTTPKSKDKTSPYPTGYFENIKKGIFVNVGCVIRFGQTKSIYNNSQMYNAMDLNNNINPSDDNVQFGNGNVPLPAKKMVSATPDDVLDLIEAKDLY